MVLKSKKFWIILIISLSLVLIFVKLNSSSDSNLLYETTKVERGDLVQTVDVVGKIKSENNISLHFEVGGIIDRVYVVEGEAVKKGDVLAKLNLDNFNLLIKQAQANLDQKIAGASSEQVNVSLKQIEAAEVANKKAELNLENIKSLANENLKNRHTVALNLLDDAYIKLFDILKFSENIRDLYFKGLSQEDIAVKNEIEYIIKNNVEIVKKDIDTLKENKVDVEDILGKTNAKIQEMINAFLFIKNISEGVSYKNTISVSDKAGIDQNKLVLSNLQIALTNIENEISLLKIQNENNINSAKLLVEETLVALDLQKANYDLIIAPLRDTDLGYLRSVLDQAIINRDKAIIKSPLTGVITKINKKEGELISAQEPFLEILSPKYQVEVNIPETDVSKLKILNKAEIELDAIDDIKLNAEIASINPSATLIQDVVYYKVVLTILDKDERIKPGMTADVLIFTDERKDVLYLLSRSILSDDKDKRYVRVLENGEVVEREVKIGLVADDAKREILEGVNEGDEIILKIIK
ncbi:MAG: efflux RND transporter periplasmic adaptor subunit [Candidatus Paceibacterota bacterium]